MQSKKELIKHMAEPTKNRKEKIHAVLLTSSGKNGAACVAAYDLGTKHFVRFVSNAVTAAGIPFEEIRGLSAFDVVEVESAQECPIGPQTENVYVKPFGLNRIGEFSGTIEDIRKEIRYLDRRSLAYSDKNRLFDVSGFLHSLEIILVNDLILRKTIKRDGSVTTRAEFKYRDKIHKDYRVTDFNFDLRNGKESEIHIPYADLILSIPKEEYIKEGRSLGYFKFIAAIFPLDLPVEEKTQPDLTSPECEQRHPTSTANSKVNAYEPWTEEEEKRLLEEFKSKLPLTNIAAKHARSYGAIRARLKKLGMIQ